MSKSVLRLVVVAVVSMVAATAWAQTFQSIFSFPVDGSKGLNPKATLTVGPDGSVYGTASAGGTAGAGTAFKVSTAGVLTPLGDFVPADTGKAPVARLVNIGDGFLYGVTSEGTGTAGDPLGTVFKLDPAGGLTKIFALPGSGTTPMRPHALTSGEANVLHVLGNSPGGIWRVPLNGDTPTNVFNFTNSNDGIFPESIIRGSDGRLYGVTNGTSFVDTTPGRQGTVFRIEAGGTGFVTLHDCDLPTGVAPFGALVEGSPGTFYGTMSDGGTNSDGVIFRLEPSSSGVVYTPFHSINDHPPIGDLLLASDGRLYGTSRTGGNNLYGSIFRINTDGSGFQVIHVFNKNNGAYPEAGLVQAPDGNLYGVTTEGGTDNEGTVFRIDLGLPNPEQNRQPIAINDFGFSSGSAVGVSVLANDFDPDDDTLTVSIETQPSAGTLALNVDGSITYFPTLGQYNGFDEFSYRITDPEGLFATATVTIANDAIPEPWQPTVYNGILHLDPSLSGSTDTPRGQVIINITASGAFTGKMFSQGKRYPIRGLFDEGGTAIAIVKMSKKNKALLFLAQGEGNSLFAAMFGQEQLTGYLSPILVPEPPISQSLTTILESENQGLPHGAGYGVVRFLSNGLVLGVGKLGDGSKFAWGTTLVSIDPATPGIPVFSEPVRNGYIAGRFIMVDPGHFLAEMKWSRPPATKGAPPYPAGFSGDVDGLMAFYNPPAKGLAPVDFGTDALAVAGVFGPSVDPGAEGVVSSEGSRLIPSDPLKSFSINRSNGLFSGKIKVGDRTVGFKGAIIQSMGIGRGHCIVDKVSSMAGFAAE